MNTNEIAAIAKKAGWVVALKSAEKVVTRNKKRTITVTVTSGLHGGLCIVQAEGKKKVNHRNIGRKQLTRILSGKAKKVATPKPGGEPFATKLEAIKGVGQSTADKLAAAYNEASLIQALKDEVDLDISSRITSALKEALL